jgi:glyoxylase-like metal-dependent hydrolase (beta-lactamase superfamily II)
LGRLFTSLVGPALDERETAVRRIEALGYDRRDVRHVVLTHLDVDHAGGIADFPEARVHVLAAEHAAAMRPEPLERARYRQAQWAHGPRWELYQPAGEPWFGFDTVRELRGLPPEILLIPLLGHTRGHAGIAVRADDGWLLHAGDAYFHHGQMDPDVPCCPRALSLFQAVVQRLPELRVQNVERLRELARDQDDVHVFSAHDQTELLRHS